MTKFGEKTGTNEGSNLEILERWKGKQKMGEVAEMGTRFEVNKTKGAFESKNL